MFTSHLLNCIAAGLLFCAVGIFVLSRYSKTEEPKQDGDESDQRIPHIDDYRDKWKKNAK